MPISDIIRENIDLSEKETFKQNIRRWKKLRNLCALPKDISDKRTFTPKRNNIDLGSL